MVYSLYRRRAALLGLFATFHGLPPGSTLKKLRQRSVQDDQRWVSSALRSRAPRVQRSFCCTARELPDHAAKSLPLVPGCPARSRRKYGKPPH